MPQWCQKAGGRSSLFCNLLPPFSHFHSQTKQPCAQANHHFANDPMGTSRLGTSLPFVADPGGTPLRTDARSQLPRPRKRVPSGRAQKAEKTHNPTRPTWRPRSRGYADHGSAEGFPRCMRWDARVIVLRICHAEECPDPFEPRAGWPLEEGIACPDGSHLQRRGPGRCAQGALPASCHGWPKRPCAGH